jgi:hypothetical protein
VQYGDGSIRVWTAVALAPLLARMKAILFSKHESAAEAVAVQTLREVSSRLAF